jgi:hypothetical protein
MTDDITAKALALVNEVQADWNYQLGSLAFKRDRNVFSEALYRAVEQHEAYKQKVSDAVDSCLRRNPTMDHTGVARFIIPKPKPDPLVEVMKKAGWADAVIYSCAPSLRAALEARGLEIREKG